MALLASNNSVRGVSQCRVRATPAVQRRIVVARAAAAPAKAGLKTVSPPEAAGLIKEGWTVLDVRPPSEVSRLGVAGAVEVPLYIPETSNDLGSLIKRWTTYSNGGWWVGATHMIPYPTFKEEVTAKIPKDKNVLVLCQTGVRSLYACSQLEKLGYGSLGWLQGGLDEAKKGELPTVPEGKDPRYGGIGGLSEQMGWTKVQQENGEPQFLGGVFTVLGAVGLFLLIDLISIPLLK